MSGPTPTRIRKHARDQTCREGGAHVPDHWDKKLFTKPYDQIIEYILNIFEHTLDEVEYYNCIPFLTQDVNKKMLFVPFRESPQYMRMLRGEDTRHTNIATPKNAFHQSMVSVRSGVRSVHVDGGINHDQ